MANDPIVIRMAGLSDHDRYVAQAQLARAEAIVDGFAWIAAQIGGAWRKAVAGVRSWNDARTRSFSDVAELLELAAFVFPDD